MQNSGGKIKMSLLPGVTHPFSTDTKKDDRVCYHVVMENIITICNSIDVYVYCI